MSDSIAANTELSHSEIWRNRLIVAASFAVIFAFSAVDHAISPMVEVFHSFFAVPLGSVLWLISYCTSGIVAGIIIGPALTRSYKTETLTIASIILLSSALGLFLFSHNFALSLALRFVFGVGSGILSTSMWWLAYEGVAKKYYEAMITVLMAARPMAVAVGVPLAGYMQMHTGWQGAFGLFLGMIIVSGIVLALTTTKDTAEKQPLSFKNIFHNYGEALAQPHAKELYAGLMIGKMCYFGIYSALGIWMIEHYGLGVEAITRQLMYIGLAETFVNFVIPPILKLGHKKVLIASLAGAVTVFAAAVYAVLPLHWSVFFLALFVILDRVYSMAVIITVPKMFPACTNKAVMGNLMTLTAWIGLTVISWFEGQFLNIIGIRAIETILLLCLAAGVVMVYRVQKITVLGKQA